MAFVIPLMDSSQKNGSKISPVVIWMIALGAGASGISGFGSMGQLGQLQNTVEEQIRVAELRGQLLAEIRSNRKQIDQNRDKIGQMITQQGALKLHKQQQALIDKLIAWTENLVTRQELITILDQRNRTRD